MWFLLGERRLKAENNGNRCQIIVENRFARHQR